MAEHTDETATDEPWGASDDLATRVAELKAEEDRRNHEKAAEEKGFSDVADYDQWLLLEELRTTTLRMRAARRIQAGMCKPNEIASLWLDAVTVHPNVGAFEYQK